MNCFITLCPALIALLLVNAVFAAQSQDCAVNCENTRCPIGYYCQVSSEKYSRSGRNFTECMQIRNSTSMYDRSLYMNVSCKGVDCPEGQKCAVDFDKGYRPKCFFKDHKRFG